ALEALLSPLFLAALQIELARPAPFFLALVFGGLGLAAASNLVAAIAAQGGGRTTLFSVLVLPVLVPLLLLAGPVTRASLPAQAAPEPILGHLLLYDGPLVVSGFMLSPPVFPPCPPCPPPRPLPAGLRRSTGCSGSGFR